MRLAVLADVHGNLHALEAVLNDVYKHDVDGFIVAGDLTGGPQSQDVVDRLRSLNAHTIRGNREEYLLAFDSGTAPAHWHSSAQWAVLRWEYGHLNRTTLDWITSLPGQRVWTSGSAAPMRIVHGSPQSASESLYPDDKADFDVFLEAAFPVPDRDPTRLKALLALLVEPVLVCAHTHIPWKQVQNGRLVVNPGSVGAPLNGDIRAQYALLDWQGGRWVANHRAVPYDLDRVRKAFRDSGFLAHGGAFARAWLLGIETARYVWGAFLAHAMRLSSGAGRDQEREIPDALLDRAVETFDWEIYRR